MIYLDNAATTLHKPPEVAEAVKNAILTAGNASRGAHGVSLSASRMVFETRSRLAKLFGCPRADHVVFTANSTEALNIAIYGLFSSGDHVISTDLGSTIPCSVRCMICRRAAYRWILYRRTVRAISAMRIWKRSFDRKPRPLSARMHPI